MSAIVLSSASRDAITSAASSNAGNKNEKNAQQEDGQESNRGRAVAGDPIVFFQDQAGVVPRRLDPPSSTICPSSSSVHTIRSTPIGATIPPSTRSFTTAGDGEETSVLVDHTMLAVVQQQQEEQRRAQEDFDSLFDDHHVFGIPYNIENSSNCYNETAAGSSHDDRGQNLLHHFYSPIKIKNNLTDSEGIGEITNNSTTNMQQSGNIFVYKKHATFEERFNQLLRFKEEFGNCNVSQKYSENPGLGQWCSSIRSMHNRVKNGSQKSLVLSQKSG